MKLFKNVLPIACACAILVSCGDKGVTSPNGKVSAVIDGQTMTVSYQPEGGSEALKAATIHIGLVTADKEMDRDLVLGKVSGKKKIVDDYEMVAGKRKHCHNEAVERTYSFKDADGAAFDLIVRAYNDGLAFRYSLPDGTLVTEDRTSYLIPDGTRRWIAALKSDYEQFFPLTTNGKPSSERMWPGMRRDIWAYPALVEPSDGLFVLISEADVRRGDSASSLQNTDDEEVYRVHLTGPAKFNEGKSPWRMAIIGGLEDLVSSTLVTDLSTPAQISTEWIEPGVSSWVYWYYNHGSKDFQINKEYIDLAVEMGWPYCLVDWEWPEMENGGDIEDVLAYAKEKNVKINLWYNSGTSWVGPTAPQPEDRLVTAERRKQELDWLAGHGVSGIKVDFFLPDSAGMVNYYLDILQDAADHHLLVDFHGCTIPRGWQRTWPNMMSMESVYGAEWYNNGPQMTNRAAAHNATLPFTRNVIGPMDYTPGTFSDTQFPHTTTYAHELALPVLFESGLQHMPDCPEAYTSLPADVLSMLSDLPSVWDDTMLLAGYPGEYVVLARKNAGKWYIAGINGADEAKSLEFSLKGTGMESLGFKLFKDGASDREFAIEDIKGQESLSVRCLPRGGFVLVSE